MNSIICENCGDSNITVVDGVPTCNSCGTKYPELDKGKISRTEKLKDEEIERLMKEEPKEQRNGRYIKTIYPEPKPGLLTDDEILKYAPKSTTGRQIRFKRKGGWSAFLKHHIILIVLGIALFPIYFDIEYFLQFFLFSPVVFGLVLLFLFLVLLLLYRDWMILIGPGLGIALFSLDSFFLLTGPIEIVQFFPMLRWVGLFLFPVLVLRYRYWVDVEKKGDWVAHFKTYWTTYYVLFILFILSIYLIQYNYGFPYQNHPYALYGGLLRLISGGLIFFSIYKERIFYE